MGIKARTSARSRFTPSIFKGFDLSVFWRDSKYVGSAPSNALIASVEAELGVRLPSSYVELMRVRNGGTPRNQFYPTAATSWADDHVAVSEVLSIGRDKTNSLCGAHGSRFMQEEWGYPDIGICIWDCPSGGHDMIMLDYRTCGRSGEPEVVHVSQEHDFEVTFLAKNFETFVRGLVNESVFSTAEKDLRSDLKRIERGSFSKLLAHLLNNYDGPELGPSIRNICKKLTNEKGYFALHADKLSLLVYDILFLLYTPSKRVSGQDMYLEDYPNMLALGDGGFTTGGYCREFVENWMRRREKSAEIVRTTSGSLEFSDDFRQALLRKAKRFAG